MKKLLQTRNAQRKHAIALQLPLLLGLMMWRLASHHFIWFLDMGHERPDKKAEPAFYGIRAYKSISIGSQASLGKIRDCP